MPASSSKASKAHKPSKGAVPATGEEHATVPVRVSPTTHQFIITEAKWGESIDRTLRRLLKIPEGAKAATGGNGR